MAEGREFEGKDLQEVLQTASASTGIAEPDLDYEIVEQGRKGLFGMGARSIRIRVMPPIHEVMDEAEQRDRPARSRAAEGRSGSRESGRRPRGRRDSGSREKENKQDAPARKARGKGASDSSAGDAGATEGTRPRDGARRGRGRGRRRSRERGRDRQRPRGDRQPESAQDHPPVQASVEDIESVGKTLQRMIDLMGLELEASAGSTECGVRVEIDGEDMNLMTQKDSQLMSAVQFLLNRMARRTWPDAGRIQLTAQGQLQQRDDELVALTREVADQVATTGESKRLHEMNAYERRLVHITIREYEALGSRSEGNGHLKRVCVFKR